MAVKIRKWSKTSFWSKNSMKIRFGILEIPIYYRFPIHQVHQCGGLVKIRKKTTIWVIFGIYLVFTGFLPTQKALFAFSPKFQLGPSNAK